LYQGLSPEPSAIRPDIRTADMVTDRRTAGTDILAGTAASGSRMVSSKGKPRRTLRSGAGGSNSHDASDAVDYEVLARFRYELRKFQAFSKAAAKRAGLTPQQHQALLSIRGFSGREPVSIGDLAQSLLIQHHTAVGLVDRMARLELLTRSIDEADGRRVLLKLTKEGERRLQKLSRINQAEIRAIGPKLTVILKLFR
jgi:DNA-binding MarR family transcriptional regulator